MALFETKVDFISGRGTHLFADKTTFIMNTEGVFGIRDDENSNSAFHYKLNMYDDREGIVRIESQRKVWKLMEYMDDTITNLFITLTVYKEANSNSDTEDISYRVNDISLAYDVDAGAIVYLRQGIRLERIMVTESISDILYEVSNTTTTTTSTTSSTSTTTSTTSSTSTSSTSSSTTTTTAEALPPIELTYTGTGSLSFSLAGTGDVTIDWGDGNVDVETLGVLSSYSHSYPTGGVASITSVENITEIVLPNKASYVTGVVIPIEAVNLTSIDLGASDITTLVTYAEWVNLVTFSSTSPTFVSMTTHAEWVNLESVTMTGNAVESFVAHAEWVNLTTLDIGGLSLNSLTLSGGLTSLSDLSIESNILTTFTTYSTWTALSSLVVVGSAFESFTTHAEWVNLTFVEINGGAFNAFVTHAEWVLLDHLSMDYCVLTTIQAHPEWTVISLFDVSYNTIASATDINNILIALDATGITSGIINLAGPGNACPTAPGLTAKASLEGRGVTVGVSTGCPTTTSTTTTTGA